MTANGDGDVAMNGHQNGLPPSASGSSRSTQNSRKRAAADISTGDDTYIDTSTGDST